MNRLFFAAVAAAALVLASACSKSDDASKTAPSATALASGAAPKTHPSASPEGSAAPVAKGAAAPNGAAASYAGTYSAAPAKYYISEAKDWASVKQVKDEPTKHVGDGAITLSIDEGGKVTGTIDSGPAAPAVIDGQRFDGEIRGIVRRKDPKDDGLTGTFRGKESAGTIDGTLALAESNASIVREGKLSLKKK